MDTKTNLLMIFGGIGSIFAGAYVIREGFRSGHFFLGRVRVISRIVLTRTATPVRFWLMVFYNSLYIIAGFVLIILGVVGLIRHNLSRLI